MAQISVHKHAEASRDTLVGMLSSATEWIRSVMRTGVPASTRRKTQSPYLLRKRELPNVFTAQDWQQALEYWDYKCAVCERPRGLWHTLAQDHWIPLTSPDCPGTDPTNILPLCHGTNGCNNSKGKQMPDLWLEKKLGRRRAVQKMVEIEQYFDWVRALKAPRLGCPQCGGAVDYRDEWHMWYCAACNVAWDQGDSRGYENCPKCQCWMIGSDGAYLCPRCNLEWDRTNLPTWEKCPGCYVGRLKWAYQLGEPCGCWRCTCCRAEWLFE